MLYMHLQEINKKKLPQKSGNYSIYQLKVINYAKNIELWGGDMHMHTYNNFKCTFFWLWE